MASVPDGSLHAGKKPPVKKADPLHGLKEDYLGIPASIRDQFGDQFANELYDGKKINKPIDTIDVRGLRFSCVAICCSAVISELHSSLLLLITY